MKSDTIESYEIKSLNKSASASTDASSRAVGILLWDNFRSQ